MADSKPSILVTIKKFRKSFPINSISLSKISTGYRNLAILDQNGCLYIRNVENGAEKELHNVQGFEWGSPATTKADEDCLSVTSDDYLLIVKNDFCLELYHIQGQDKAEDTEDKLVASCDVQVTEDLLKGLLRDRGKVSGDFSIQDLSIIAMETEKNPTNHVTTLLVNHKYIVVLSLSVSGTDVVCCFALDNSTTSLPLVVPVSSLVQVIQCQSLVFCLFSSGTIIIHLVNGEFIGCVDIQSYHFNSQDTDSELDDQFDDTQFPAKFTQIDVTDDLSILVSCDESNNIYTVVLDDYFEDNPNHLCFKNKMSKRTFKPSQSGLQYSSEDEDLMMRNTKMSDIGYGDRFWKNELVEMRVEARQECSTIGFPSSRWFNHIKEIKLSIPSHHSHNKNRSTRDTKLSGFLLKRKKSDTRSATPSSEGSISINSKELVIPKCSLSEMKSLVYKADMFAREQKLVKLSAGSDSLLVWFQPYEAKSPDIDSGPGFAQGLFYLYGYGRTEVAYHQIFSAPTAMVQSSVPMQSVCVLTKKLLSIPSFGVNQDQFVHKVIMYENAALAEEVCRVNQWDHCVIPMGALQVALKHRQLDTIAFFLKTQENVFTTSNIGITSPTTALSPQQSISSSPAIQNTPVTMDTRQTEDVIKALVSSVERNSKQHHNRQFTNQLLQLTLKYLHCLLQDGTLFLERKRTETDTQAQQHSELGIVVQIEKCLMYVTESIDKLRHYLSNLPDDGDVDDTDGCDSSAVLNDIGEGSWDIMGKWISMDTKDIIRDAVVHGNVGTAQAFFISKAKSQFPCDGSLSSITATGLDIMLSSLINQDIDTAMKIISNLGRDVMDQLRVLCFNTLHRPLREFLICELRSRGQLTLDEEEMIQFVHALENIYGTQNYELAKKSVKPQLDSWTDFVPLQSTFSLDSSRILEMNVEPGSLLPRQLNNENQHGGYAEVLLEWVREWSPEERQRILFERIVWNRDSSKNSFHISAKAIWHYFTSRADWQNLKGWIRAMAGEDVSHGNVTICVGEELFVSEDKIVLPLLTRDVYSELPGCPDAVKEIIVDELTRHGFFTYEQLSNLSALLYHLGRTQTLFTKPHPLEHLNVEQTSDHHGDVNQCQVMSLGDFHGRFIEYCIKMQFVNVLHYYLDFYRLSESMDDVRELKLDKQQPAWVEMMILFRLAGIRPEDTNCTYSASFSNARFVLNSESSISVSDMFREGRPIMALATLMYGPRPISQAIVPNGEAPEDPNWQVEEDLLRRSLTSHPKLLNALFPIKTSIHGSEPQDITVYQLLQGNCQFEISRLFGWQHTNALARKAGNVGEMPHFSHAPTVSKYAHTEKLTFSYYLRHGRPSFAFNAFVVTQIKEPNISKTSLNIAIKKAYRIAIQNFTNTQITTSCVMFYELLGTDSKGLRVDLMACNRIQSHGGRDCMQNVQSSDGDRLQDKIVSELMSRRSNLQNSFLPALEQATGNLVSSTCPDKTSFEASQYWSLVIDFCYGHKVDLSTQYLMDCAVADQWLQFVCFAQRWQFPKHKVLDVIENHFSNRHYKEHLKLAFENVQIITVEQSEESSKKRRRKKQTKKEKHQVVTPTKDIRAQFYARMGLSKTGKDSGQQSSSAEEEDEKMRIKQQNNKDSSSATDGTVTAVDEDGIRSKGSIESQERPLDPDKLPDDFFDVLFTCNDAKIPWRSLLAHAIALHRPLFAVLAACYEESKPIDCICSWMFSTYNPAILDAVASDITEIQWRRWNTRDLILIITILVKYKATYAVTLAKAFYIFEPTNPMLHFLRFHESFVVYIDFDTCREELTLFKKAFSKISVRESSISTTDLTITREIKWIEEVTSLVTQQMIRQCDNSYEQGHLLSLLAKAMFGRNYSYKTPNYYQLHKINEITQDTKVVVDFSLLLEESSEDASRESQRILQSLLQNKDFVKAREYARLLQLPEDPITLKEVQHERESIENSVLWEIKQGRLAFWHKADKCFTDNRCSPEIAASFFEAQAEDSELTYTEKSRLLSMTMKWCSKSTRKPSELTDKMIDLERSIWLHCIRAEMENNKEVKFARSVSHLEFLPSSSDWATGFPVPFSDAPTGDVAEATELIADETTDDVDVVTCADLLTTNEEFSALDRVIGQLLGNCHVIQARRLAVHFGYTSRDLDIVLSCIYLSQGTRFADTLDESMKKLLHRTPHRRISVPGTEPSRDGIRRSGSFVLSTSFSESGGTSGRADDSISVDWIQVEDTITAMETLMYYCKTGKKCCTRIITCYKISQSLGIEYESVVTDKPFNILHSLLVSGFDLRFKLAEAYIKAFDLNPNEVVGFLKDIILLSLRVYCGEELSTGSGDHELIFNAAPSCDDIIEVIKLCSDQTLLGNRLLETAGGIANERIAGNATDKALNLEVELLVRAHECHTMACNMEGITSVLKCGKHLTDAIAGAERFPLMVRLLTGVGRYREMSYIFDNLLEHHYFELLFQRGLIDKEKKLKVALLEYLKRSHPEDTEKFKMVAMRFSMHRELADRWENTAMEQLNELKGQKLSSQPEVQARLTSIMNSFKYATDYYKKDSCFKLSQTCIKYARLVQLQIHFLPLGINVINLDERGLKNFLAQHNHFFESLLVVDAYNKKGALWWVNAVYNHVVVNGDFKYWQELRSVMIPPSVLFVDVATKYKNSDNHSSQEVQNMKKLLTDLPELRVRYRVASDLGFIDISSAILEGEGGAYLKDVLGL